MKKKRVRKVGPYLKLPGHFNVVVDEAEERLLHCLNAQPISGSEFRAHVRTVNRFVRLRRLATGDFNERAEVFNEDEDEPTAVIEAVNKELQDLPFYPKAITQGDSCRLTWIQDSRVGRNEDVPEDEWSLYLTTLQIFSTGKIKAYDRCACGCGTWFIKYKPEHTFASEEHKERSRQTDAQRKAARAEKASKVYLAWLRQQPGGEKKVARLLALRQKRRPSPDKSPESHTASAVKIRRVNR